MTDNLVLPAGSKYALLALPNRNFGTDAGDFEALGDDCFFSRNLPVDVPQHWKEWLGELRFDRLAETRFYLFACRAAEQPHDLNEENEALQHAVYRLHLGLAIAVDYIGHARTIGIAGAQHRDRSDVREVADHYAVCYTAGSPRARCSAAKLRGAARRAAAIAALGEGGQHRVIGSALRTFREGLRAEDADVRLHQFVRTVEAFVVPGKVSIKKTFVERTQLFTGRAASYKSLLDTLYDLRSVAEHQRDPVAEVRAATERERRVGFLLHAVQAETLARYCLSVFLSTPQLWPLFADDAIEAFWAKGDRWRRGRWSIRLAVDEVKRNFRGDQLSDAVLGL